MKICTKCKTEKTFDSFGIDKYRPDGYKIYCKNCVKTNFNKNRKEYLLKYYESNKEKMLEKQKERYVEKKDYILQYGKEYRSNNKQKIKEYNKVNKDKINSWTRKYREKRKKEDNVFKFKSNVRSLITSSFKRGTNQFRKNAKTETILGCTIQEFIKHIQSKFTEGMTLNNHGEWHLDHIYPVSLATTEEQIIKLNHYTNFQPLWAEDNLSKGSKIL